MTEQTEREERRPSPGGHRGGELRAALRAGRGAVWGYTGLGLALFAVQLAVTAGGIAVVARIFASAFAKRPLFDDAVDGDVVAMLAVVRAVPAAFSSAAWSCVGVIGAYLVISWFTTGGLVAVLLERPSGRRETARCFGAGGAASFFAYARLGLLSAIPYVVILVVAGIGVAVAADATDRLLSLMALIWALLAGLAPGAVLAWLFFTAVDYARIDLSSHPGLSATRALGRGLGFVLSRPAPLLHVALYYGLFLALSLGFVWLTLGHPMLGTSGAISLFVVRQGVAILRFAARVALLGGQIELGRDRAAPRRRVNVS